jgi:hypothetical protein
MQPLEIIEKVQVHTPLGMLSNGYLVPCNI